MAANTLHADGAAVETIADLAREGQNIASLVKEHDGKLFSTRTLHTYDPREKEQPIAPLVLHTLTGFVDYIKANRDEVPLDECILHVASPTTVHLVTKLRGHFQQRHTYVTAKAHDRFGGVSGFTFGQYLDTEQMVVSLHALFANGGHREGVLRMLSSVKAENGIAQADDGVSQIVTARKGAALVERVEIPNPVTLLPFRTFPEVPQPASPFVLRVKLLERGDEKKITAALFEADGGAWQADAVLTVAYYLREKLGPDSPLAVVA